MDKLIFHVFLRLAMLSLPCAKNSIGRFLELSGSGQKVILIAIEMKVSVT